MVLTRGPQRLGPLRKVGLLKRREMGVLLFILTCSTQSLTLASQLRRRGSSAMYTKQCSKLHEHTGDENSQKQRQPNLEIVLENVM